MSDRDPDLGRATQPDYGYEANHLVRTPTRLYLFAQLVLPIASFGVLSVVRADEWDEQAYWGVPVVAVLLAVLVLYALATRHASHRWIKSCVITGVLSSPVLLAHLDELSPDTPTTATATVVVACALAPVGLAMLAVRMLRDTPGDFVETDMMLEFKLRGELDGTCRVGSDLVQVVVKRGKGSEWDHFDQVRMSAVLDVGATTLHGISAVEIGLGYELKVTDGPALVLRVARPGRDEDADESEVWKLATDDVSSAVDAITRRRDRYRQRVGDQ